MGLSDLFKGEAERERDRKKQRRKAVRLAERGLDDLRGKKDRLKRDCDQAWNEARDFMRDGQKVAAQQRLKTYRASQLLQSKIQMKHWVAQQIVTKLEMSSIDMDLAGALQALDRVIEIDPDRIADVLDDVSDTLGEQLDSDKVWERAYQSETEGLEASDQIPSLEELETQLVDEAAAEIAHKTRKSKSKAKTKEGPGLDDKIRAGRDRLKDLLDGK